MPVAEAQLILDQLRGLEDLPIVNAKKVFHVIDGLIGQIGRYGQKLDAALVKNAKATDFHRQNLCDLLRELEQLTLDDPLLLDRIGLIRAAFAAAFERATADIAAENTAPNRRNDLARITLPS